VETEVTVLCRACLALTLLVSLAACTMGGPVSPTAADYARALEPTIRPGETFRFPSEHHLTLSGSYGLPTGAFQLVFVCTDEAGYQIDVQAGRKNGTCARTGTSNSITEQGVIGPGTLTITIVAGTIDVMVK
jgi:hypothetical protein